MPVWLIVVLIAAACVLIIAAVWRPLQRFGREVHTERARELFKLQRERLETLFFQAASQSGKPRGLRWKDCAWDDSVRFARDRKTNEIVALIGVTIQFEAVEGSDMEGLPAVGNLSNASADFFFRRGDWLTTGKAVFNMNPDEALSHFEAQYERIPAESTSAM